MIQQAQAMETLHLDQPQNRELQVSREQAAEITAVTNLPHKLRSNNG
jgi:hypothetical protein